MADLMYLVVSSRFNRVVTLSFPSRSDKRQSSPLLIQQISQIHHSKLCGTCKDPAILYHGLACLPKEFKNIRRAVLEQVQLAAGDHLRVRRYFSLTLGEIPATSMGLL